MLLQKAATLVFITHGMLVTVIKDVIQNQQISGYVWTRLLTLVQYRSETESQVKGYSSSKFKSFNTRQEAEAFINSNSSTSSNSGGGYSGSYGGGYSGSYGSTRSQPSSYRSDSSFQSRTSSRPDFSSASEPSERCVVYTDGSSRGNGKQGAQAGVGVWYGHDDPRNVSRSLPGSVQTNQRAELTAVYDALNQGLRDKPSELVIKTDSKYAISSNTEWARTWEKNNYTNSQGEPVKNQDLIKESQSIMKQLGESGTKVTFEHVRGHSNVHGNEMADSLANSGAMR